MYSTPHLVVIHSPPPEVGPGGGLPYIYIYIYVKSQETTNKSEDALERFGDVVVNVLCFVFLFFGWFSGSLVAWLFACLVPCLFYCFLFCSCC